MTRHTVPETRRIDDDIQFTIDTPSEMSSHLTLKNDDNNQTSVMGR